MFKTQRKRNYTDKLGYGYKGKPQGDNSPEDFISLQAMRNLPKSSYALQADPYEAALPTSEPYPILNKFNKLVGGDYSGEDNIDGGNVQQYANSTTSNFLKAFDVMRTKIGVNYRYLPIDPSNTGDSYPGYQLIDEMRKSIAESVSLLKSTTFTQMAINQFAIVTDLPMGSAITSNISSNSTPINAYTETTDVIYAMSIYYQLFLQEALSVMNWHNSFRLKQGVAIKNAWNREVPNLNSFFGLMNKKAFLSLLESINLSFEGEYVDKGFMKQMNMLTLIPSRRSDSITDPILEIQANFIHPTVFKIYVLDDNGQAISEIPLYDDANLALTIPVGGTSTVVSFWEACDQLKNYLSLEATQLWARTNYVPASVTLTDNARYNQIKAYFDVLIASFTLFKPSWSDYREALDVMVRTGTLAWEKGFRPGIVKDTDVDIFWNVMVDHIYQMIYSGPVSLNYDDATKRWRTFSLWNMYSGIPSYDKKSGGSFLSFSFKDFTNIPTNSEQLEYLPILFSAMNSPVCVAVSRDGREATISLSSQIISENVVLKRLAPLTSQANLEIRVPTIQFTANSNLDKGHFSNLYKMLTQVFGLCRVQSSASGVYDVALDPDILAIYQIEITDITNMAITYARANAPFKGTTSEQGLLGFTSVN